MYSLFAATNSACSSSLLIKELGLQASEKCLAKTAAIAPPPVAPLIDAGGFLIFPNFDFHRDQKSVVEFNASSRAVFTVFLTSNFLCFILFRKSLRALI